MDWVPAHFPKDAHALAEFDGTDLYEHADPRQGEHQDWGTLIFNFGRNEVRNFLIANALFWLDKYHIDGLRVDAVASMLYLDYSRKPGEWIPNAFGGRENLEAVLFPQADQRTLLRAFPRRHDDRRGINRLARRLAPDVSGRPRLRVQMEHGLDARLPALHGARPDLSGASIRTASPSRSCMPSRSTSFSCSATTRSSTAKARCINKMPGDEWQQFANLRMFYAWMFGHPGKKLLFMGGEFGQRARVESRPRTGLGADRTCRATTACAGLVQHLNHVYRSEPGALGHATIPTKASSGSIFTMPTTAWSRSCGARGKAELLVFAVNATPVVRYNYRLGVPSDGFLSRDHQHRRRDLRRQQRRATSAGCEADAVEWQGRTHSIVINLPPLAVMAFKREAPDDSPKRRNRLVIWRLMLRLPLRGRVRKNLLFSC